MQQHVTKRARAGGVWLALALCWPLAASPAPSAPRRIEVSDALQTAFILPAKTAATGDAAPPVSISPDGRRFAVRIARGDLARDGVRLDILSGGLGSLADAARLSAAATFFTRAFGRAESPYHPALNSFAAPVWLDDRSIAFPWEDENGVIQYAAVDLVARRRTWLTHHSTDVLVAVANRRGDLFYAATRAADGEADARLARGFIVDQPDAVSAMRAGTSGTLAQYYDLDLFLAHGAAPPRKLDLRLRWVIGIQPSLSPDGRYLLVNAWPARLPPEWRGAYRVPPGGADVIAAAFTDRNSWYGRQISQLFLVDMRSGTARPLWNAPTSDPYRMKLAWSADGRQVFVSPTYLPAGSADAAGISGQAAAVVDVESGAAAPVALPAGLAAGAVTAVSLAADRLTLAAGALAYHFRRQGGSWSLVDQGKLAVADADAAPVRIELRQSANLPPTLHAIDRASGQDRMILDPNPGLAERFALGRVEPIAFPDREGRSWSALLYHPVGEQRGHRYPLVIQAHGHAPVDRFSLYGLGLTAPGLGPSWSVYAAQPLAGRGMFVLQLEDKRIAGIDQTPAEPRLYMRAYEAAVDYLDSKGLIDRSRVGLAGFSRSGWHIEYALTHSDFVFAAAIASDNISASYLEDVLDPGGLDLENGGAPYGKQLESWLETAPGFSVERVRTPLRSQVESGGSAGILLKWEMFARLRQIGAPVELAVVPQVDRGSHNLLNPGQLMAVKQGAVDWFDFWLNGREDGSPAKAEQYRRWRRLRDQRDALLKTERPPLLDWSASPLGSGRLR